MLGDTRCRPPPALRICTLDHDPVVAAVPPAESRMRTLKSTSRNVGELGIDRNQCLSQRSIEGIDRAVALAHLHRPAAGERRASP